MAHIDLSSPCQFDYWRTATHFDFFEVEDDVRNWRGKIGRNHLCVNDTQCGGPICTNPLHWYYGTNKENMLDVPDKERFKVGGRKNKGRKDTEEQRQRKRGPKAPFTEQRKENLRLAALRRWENYRNEKDSTSR